MSLSTEGKIRSILIDDTARIIARYCKTPHNSSEIVREVMRQKQDAERSFWERIVSQNLTMMESAAAIIYSAGKWNTTQIALNVLEKFFGG